MNSSVCFDVSRWTFLSLNTPTLAPSHTHIVNQKKVGRKEERKKEREEKSKTHSHDHTRNTNIRTQPLPDPRRLPQRRHNPVFLVAIDYAREHRVCVCRGADCEEDDEKEGLEVEEGGLLGVLT